MNCQIAPPGHIVNRNIPSIAANAWKIEICINDAIGKCLADCFMHGCIINSCSSIKSKWFLKIPCQLVVNTEEEVKQISGPVSRTGLDPIRPADRGIEDFPIIQKVFWEIADNTIFFTKHQQSSGSWPEFTFSLQSSYRAYFLQV